MPAKVTGGEKLDRFIQNVERNQRRGVKRVDVGFFSTARYPPVHTGKGGGRARTPVSVTSVAAWNEFGTEHAWGDIPERPFFRNAIDQMPAVLTPIMRAYLQPDDLTLDKQLAGLLGEAAKGVIQKSIRDFDDPGNEDSTKALKGSSNPLIDTGFMLNSVSWLIVEAK